MKTRARLAVWMLAALMLPAMMWMACTLNPQPIPPGADLDSPTNSGQDRGDAGGSGMGHDDGGMGEPPGGDAGDAGDADASDTSDAGDAGDAGDAAADASADAD